MKYWGRGDYSHEEVGRAGVLLINLGTPQAPNVHAVRRYLAQFLSDPRVIELSAPLRWLLLHGVILRLRPRKTLRAYKAIWSKAGSPLMVHTRALEQSVRDALATRAEGPVSVALAMRYGEPTVEQALRVLMKAGVERLLVLPLYPQYSGATTGAASDALGAALAQLRWVPTLRFVNHYHDHPRYVDAVAASVREAWAGEGPSERLLLSFHGMPRATLTAGDPYHCQCQGSARLIAQSLGLARGDWALAFQSRFGRAAWLQPDTEATLRGWAEAGIKSVTVVCPGFAVDCLETLEEVAQRYREVFLGAGGKRFVTVPALNAGAAHTQLLTELAVSEMAGWPEALASYNAHSRRHEAAYRAERARRLGAAD
ncbi:MAG: ferrochelatase [Gammaproteobacteria bacterium]